MAENLPGWVKEHIESYGHEVCDADECPIYKVLQIAWDALEAYKQIRINNVGVGGIARDAIRQIEELGK